MLVPTLASLATHREPSIPDRTTPWEPPYGIDRSHKLPKVTGGGGHPQPSRDHRSPSLGYSTSQPRLHEAQLTTHSLEEHWHAQGDGRPEPALTSLGSSARRTEGEEFPPGNAKWLCPPF